MRTRWGSWLVGALATALAASVLGLVGAGPAAADPTAATGDESVSVPAGYIFYTGQTTAQISQKLGSTYRLVDLHETSPNVYSFAAVGNSGAYAVPGWWWFVNVTPATVSAEINATGGRLISAERNGDGTMNVILVSNTGASAKAWWWFFGVTPAQISSFLSSTPARIVSLDQEGAGGTFTVVLVSNTGADAKAWWWFFGVTPAQISSQLNSNNARLVDLDTSGNGTFNVVMVAQSGSDNKAWKWLFGTSASTILDTPVQTGYRVFDFQPYVSGGTTVYSAVMIDNLDPENRRVENVLEAGYQAAGLSGARYGYYVKRIGGTPVLALRDDAGYEPASGIKALYNLYAERQVQVGGDSLGSSFNYWFDPAQPSNKDICPLNIADTPANQVTTTLQDGLDRMMGVSDNRTTQGVDLRYGRANVNSYAASIGMTGTTINQTVGCGNRNGGFVTLTLDDITRLYEGVQQNTLLSSTRSASFFGRMNGGAMSAGSAFGQMVAQEAAAQGKSGIAGQFTAAITFRVKGGSYDMCFPSGPCPPPPYDYVRSNAGVLTLPVRTGGVLTPTTYAYGWWVNDVRIPCAFNVNCAARAQADATTSTLDPELFRAQVRAALQTW